MRVLIAKLILKILVPNAKKLGTMDAAGKVHF